MSSNERIAGIERSLHRYGEDRSQLGELFLPDRADDVPVAVVIHGGFWRDAWDRPRSNLGRVGERLRLALVS